MWLHVSNPELKVCGEKSFRNTCVCVCVCVYHEYVCECTCVCVCVTEYLATQTCGNSWREVARSPDDCGRGLMFGSGHLSTPACTLKELS